MTITVRPAPAAPPARSARPATGTRTRLRLGAGAIVGLVLALGLATYLRTAGSDSAIGHAATNAEPLSVAAEDVYRSLSDADATAAALFLSGAQVQTGGLQRYNSDIQRVSSGLSAISAQSGTSPPLHDAVGQILADLPAYTGLVGTAQADSRQDLPVGAAYLREASALMRSALLPAAQRVLGVQTDRLAADDAAAGSGQQWALGAAALALTALCLVQAFLVRRTRRLLNPGMAAATLLVLALGSWVAIASGGAADAAGAARGHRNAADALTSADLAVLQAHGDELLGLAARGEDVGSYEGDFKAVSARLGELLGSARGPDFSDARTAYQGWMKDHGALVHLETSPQADNQANLGALAEVTATATGTGGYFARIDGDLRAAAPVEQAAYLAAIGEGGADLRGLANGGTALALAALAAGSFGVNRRLREYR
jgi:hypothetical protein